MRNFFVILICIFFVNNQSYSQELKKTYFGGGCFWCMEESFDKVDGVINVVSGYSGGTKPNPTYKEVTYGDTGHIEVVEITYDTKKISFAELLNIFWKNIDPFDATGQFCDKGYSYRSVAFYQNDDEKKLIENSIKVLKKKFNKEIVTYVRSFDKFYQAEVYHQDFYVKKFQRYVEYKKACRRDEILNNIWNL